MRPSQDSVAMNTAALAASNATHSRRSGSTSANQGSIHRSYWGEYALFVSRKSTSKGNANVQRGKSGRLRAVSCHTASAPMKSAMTDNGLKILFPPQPTLPVIAWHPTDQIVTIWAGRTELKRKK